MGKRVLLSVAVSAALALVVAACGSSGGGGSGGSSSKSPILLGISAAKTGALEPYDLQSGQLFEMRINQINKSGGVLGRKLKVKWLDSKSDKATDAANTNLLLSQGAKVIVGTCDFDYGAPAVLTATAKKTPGAFLCASGFKAADPSVVSQYGGSMGLGSDTEGTAMADWARSTHPQWKSVYVLKDTSLEYSIDTANYFKAAWQKAGGTICGQNSFVGSPTLDLSPQITALRGAVSHCDAVFDGSWQPYGSQVIRAIRDAGLNIPILTNASVNGTDIDKIGGKVSNFYALSFACDPDYCQGTKTPDATTLNNQFKSTYGTPINNAYAYSGWVLANAVVDAIKAAGSTNGLAIAKHLWNQPINYLGHSMSTSSKCHRPRPAVYSVEQYTNGVDKQLGFQKVKSVPNIGDGNPCAGTQ